MSPSTPIRRPPSVARWRSAFSALNMAIDYEQETAKLMADKGAWLSTVRFLSEEDTGRLTGQSRLNALQVSLGTSTPTRSRRSTRSRQRSSSDLFVFERPGCPSGRHADPSQALVRKRGHSPHGDFRQRELALSGPRNPYPGKLGWSSRRWLTSSSSTAIRSTTSRFSKSPKRIGDDEGGRIHKDIPKG